jgi:hypothetical protein
MSGVVGPADLITSTAGLEAEGVPPIHFRAACAFAWLSCCALFVEAQMEKLVLSNEDAR